MFDKKEKKEIQEDDNSEDPSPIKKFGQMKLEAIDEIDSFCTDSSYQPSPEFFAKSACKVDKEKFLDVLKIPEEEFEYGPGEGSPLKKELLKPELTINEMIQNAKKSATNDVLSKSSCLFKMHECPKPEEFPKPTLLKRQNNKNFAVGTQKQIISLNN